MRSYLQRSAIVFAQICAEDPQTVLAVKRRLIALSPDGSDDDVCWVWYLLARRFPHIVDYGYTDRQIRWAWRCVRQNRLRQDNLGSRGRRAEARRRRQKALGRLAAELHWSVAELSLLDVNDYNTSEHTLAMVAKSGEKLIEVSRAVRATDRWLRLRGCQPGALFELPTLPESREESLASHPEVARISSAQDSAKQVEQEDALERPCEGRSSMACAFLLKNMCDRGGDWSLRLLRKRLPL